MNLKKYPKVSIIIPLYVKTLYFYESVEKCLELDYPNYEILIGMDKNQSFNFKNDKVKVLTTSEKNTGPAEKRDIGILHSTGQIIAFLDDDSYPSKDWLKKSVEILLSKKVAGVCGPGLTPPNDTFFQKITGAVLGSKFGSGPYYYRFIKASARYVDDYPAYNMIVRKDVLEKVGGFGTKYYGGEDTALCLKLIEAGEKMFYSPNITVFHHRRAFPIDYAKQVGNVGLHRGFFVKKYPKTSLRLSYFMPTIATLTFFILLVLSLIHLHFFRTLMIGLGLSYILVFIDSYKDNDFSINIFLPVGVILNHIFYGLNFLKGLLFTDKLTR